MRAGKRWQRHQPDTGNGPTAADVFKERLGWKPSMTPFHTTAKRGCGGCGEIKPGAEFDVPITPGRPDLNLCRICLLSGRS